MFKVGDLVLVNGKIITTDEYVCAKGYISSLKIYDRVECAYVNFIGSPNNNLFSALFPLSCLTKIEY